MGEVVAQMDIPWCVCVYMLPPEYAATINGYSIIHILNAQDAGGTGYIGVWCGDNAPLFLSFIVTWEGCIHGIVGIARVNNNFYEIHYFYLFIGK